MGIFKKDKKKKKAYTEYDESGAPLARIEYYHHGSKQKKIRIDLKKKEALLRKKGVPFIIDDRRQAPIMSLLKELYQYRHVLSATPKDLKEEIVKRIDTSYTLVDLEFIGGEGAVFGVLNLKGKKLALKIALPFEQVAGRRVMFEEEDIDARQKKIIVQDINDFKTRFTEGAGLQDEVADLLAEEGITWFGVPHASISTDPVLHIIMPWIHGPNLNHRDNKELKYTLELYVKILDAVAYLHQFGIVHRDIKAENILVAPRGKKECIYLVDWTLAKYSGDRGLTVPGIGLGTEGNASPKQLALRDAMHATAMDDLWGLGLLLYEIIYSRRRPRMLRKRDFYDEDKIKQYVTKLAEYIPLALRSVFVKATQIDEKNRYQSVTEMKTAVLEAIEKLDYSEAEEAIDIGTSRITEDIPDDSRTDLPVAEITETDYEKILETVPDGNIIMLWYKAIKEIINEF